MKSKNRKQASLILAAAFAAPAVALADPSATVDYAWNYDGATASSLSWGNVASWTPEAPAGGPDAAGLYVTLTNDITVARTITLFNTGDAGDATKTIGRLDIGDASHNFTVTVGSAGGVLEFDGNNGLARLNQVAAASGGNIIGAPINLVTGLQVDNASSNPLSIGTITGSAGLIVNSGVLQITVLNNTFSGGVTVNSGATLLSTSSAPNPPNTAAFGTGKLTLQDGSTVAARSGFNNFKTFANETSLAGHVTFGATGNTNQLSFSGASSIAGGSTITSNGLGGTGINLGSLTGAIALGGALTVNGPTATRFDGTVSGSGPILVNSGATLAFNRSNTTTLSSNITVATGATISSGGVTGAFGSGSVTFGSGSSSSTALTSANSGTVSLPLFVNGLLNLPTSSNSAGMSISGSIQDGAAAPGAVYFASSGGVYNWTLTAAAGNPFSGGLTLENSGTTSSNITSQNVVTLNANAANTLGSGVVTLINTRTSTGTWTAPFVASIVVAADQSFGGLSSGSTPTALQAQRIINSNSTTFRTLSLSVAPGSLTYSGTVGIGTTTSTNGDRLNVIKSGSGQQTFASANTYSGSTQVTGGALWVNGGHNTAGAYTVAAGGLLGGNSAINTTLNAGLTALSGSRVAPGPSVGTIGTLELNVGSGAVDLSGTTAGNNAALRFDLNTIASSDRILLGNAASLLNVGTLDVEDFAFGFGAGLQTGTYTLIETGSSITGSLGNTAYNYGGVVGTLQFSGDNTDVQLFVSAVPEPASLSLLGLGAAALLKRRRRA